MTITTLRIEDIAGNIARSLLRVTTRDEIARLSTPLIYPGGSLVGVEISRLRDGFLVSDGGGARREAELLGGERSFTRLASEVADYHGVRFDRNMIFDVDVMEPDLNLAVIAVANAAKVAVDRTALHLVSTEHAQPPASLWERLERLYGSNAVERHRKVRGASDVWTFDAAIEREGRLSLFEVVSPYASAVNSAVIKFLDVRDLGPAAPTRVAVLLKKSDTPHLTVLERTALIVEADDKDEAFLRAA